MEKSMRRILFIIVVLLSLVACKEDLSEYYNRLDQREAANKRVEDDINELEKENAKLDDENAKLDAENANLDAENAAQAARNEEREQWNMEQLLRNAEQGLLNDSMRHVLDSLMIVKGMYLDYADVLKRDVDNQAQYNADQAQRNGQLRLMWEDLMQRIESLERLFEESVEPEVLSMEFLKADNSSLRQDVKCKIIGDSIIDCWLPGQTNEKVLKPRFSFAGTMIVIDGYEAESGKTTIDFTKPRKVVVATSKRNKYYTIYVHSFTGLPMMYITTDGLRDVTSKDTYIGANLVLKEDVRTRAAGDVVESRVNIKGRGNSSWKFPKKPYRLKFDEKVSMLDMHKDKSWVLIPNYNDKSMLRNSLAFYMSSISNLDYTPECHFIELIFNGKYKGTYQLCEKLKISNHRVAVGDDGFLLEIDFRATGEADSRYFQVPHLESVVNIKDPEVEYSDANYRYVKDFIIKADDALFGNKFTDPTTGWQAYLDMESFVDWYLIQEIGKNLDGAFATSCYMHLARGGKLMMGPIWDMDVAYGNIDQANQSCYRPTGFHVKNVKWYARLFKDPAFVKRVKERFNYFYRHQNEILANVNADAQYLRYSAQENNDVWGVLNAKTWPNYNIWGSYQNEVQELKEWFVTRMDWLKIQFDAM
jgi:cell division protein FtsB